MAALHRVSRASRMHQDAGVAVSGRPPAGAVCQSYSPPRVRCARPIMRGSVWAHEVLGHTNETLRRSGGGSRVARIPHSTTPGLHVLVVTCQDWFLGVAIWGPLLQGLVVPLSLGFGGCGVGGQPDYRVLLPSRRPASRRGGRSRIPGCLPSRRYRLTNLLDFRSPTLRHVFQGCESR